jgi:phosphoserine phosphatase RsbU/P
METAIVEKRASVVAMPAGHRRLVLLYSVAAILLAASVTYQIRVMAFRFPQWFPHHRADYRLLELEPGPDGLTVGWTDARAARAGIRQGNILAAVNGRPLISIGAFGQIEAKTPQGQKLLLTILRPGGHGALARREVSYVMPHPAFGINSLRLLLFLIMPVFCVALGFWVVAVRPRDNRAWLLLAFMLSFSTFMDPGTEFWSRGLRDFGEAYRLAFSGNWPLWIFLLGIYFPEPLALTTRRRGWRELQWAIVAVLAFYAALYGIIAVGALENYTSVANLNRLLERLPIHTAYTVLTSVAVSAFFASIFYKWRVASSADAKRRLRLLSASALVSFTPFLVLVVISSIKGVALENYFPSWLYISSYVMLSIFPVTLAYTIVVHKAMDVHVVVRQGLQYAFATAGIRVLQLVLGILSGLAAYFIAKRAHNWGVSIAVVVAWAILALRGRKSFQRLKTWTDRRFFRDAYDAEQILTELSDKVRTIVEAQPLFATVSHRIAESLHVSRVVVMVNGSGPYRPAFALGYSGTPQVAFAEDSATVRQLTETGEPTRVYLDDPHSWVYHRKDMTENERQQLAELAAELLLPLAVKDHLLGITGLGQKRSEEPYSGGDLRLLKSVAAQTGLALEIASLTATVSRAVAEREKLNQELEIAREVQQRLFPQKLPPVAGLEYAGACRPARGVGGDYYDFLALPEGRLGIAIGDVSGKGIAAALMMATLQASLRAEAVRQSQSLACMIAGVNRLVFDASTANRYATFFYAEYNACGQALTYVNAGHNPPMLFRRCPETKSLMRLDVGGTVIGLLENVGFQQATVSLQPEDMLVLYTDGVSEAMNPHDEEWGEERMMEAIRHCHGLSAAETIEHVMTAADIFSAGAPQHDDMTLVVLRLAVREESGCDQ